VIFSAKKKMLADFLKDKIWHIIIDLNLRISMIEELGISMIKGNI